MSEASPLGSTELSPRRGTWISRAISGKHTAGLMGFLAEIGFATGVGATIGGGMGLFIGQPLLGAVIGGIGGALTGFIARSLRYRDP